MSEFYTKYLINLVLKSRNGDLKATALKKLINKAESIRTSVLMREAEESVSDYDSDHEDEDEIEIKKSIEIIEEVISEVPELAKYFTYVLGCLNDRFENYEHIVKYKGILNEAVLVYRLSIS